MGRARCDFILAGSKFDFGSLEESLALNALNRRSEIEFMKLMVVVNAIISVGNRVCAAVSSSDTPTSDALKKSIDSLKQLLLPHWAEDTERRAKAAKDMLVKEVTRGPLTVKVLGRDQNKRKRKK